eukprot:g23660.t1
MKAPLLGGELGSDAHARAGPGGLDVPRLRSDSIPRAGSYTVARPPHASPGRLVTSRSSLTTQPQIYADVTSSLQRHRTLVYSEMDVKTLCDQLHVKPDKGLSSAVVEERLVMYGRNELESQPPPTFWEVLIDQFKDVVVIILIIGACISMGLQEYAAGGAILVIVAFNALLGVKMELSATQAILDLHNQNPETSEVLRDGHVKTVPTYSLVPGDIVMLGTGTKVPADLRLVESAVLECNEMPLTGESMPSKKDAKFVQPHPDDVRRRLGDLTDVSANGRSESFGRGSGKEEALNPPNLAFMGCMVETGNGNGKGVVVRTGMKTAMGSIQRQLHLADEDVSPLAEKLAGLGTKLGYASIAISVVVLVLMRVVLGNSWLDALLVAVSLTVAAVPEGLPVCVTIALAVGMRTMAGQHRAQILRLKSVETLGSATVICSDKTGTLTKGVMTAVGQWMAGRRFRFTGVGYDPNGDLCIENDPADKASMADAASPRSTLGSLEKLEQGSIFSLPTLLGSLCSNARLEFVAETQSWQASGDISERPLVVASRKAGFEPSTLQAHFPRRHENPFSSNRKMMSTLHDISDEECTVNSTFRTAKYLVCVKGAPNVVLEKCTHVLRPKAEDSKDNVMLAHLCRPVQAQVAGQDFRKRRTWPTKQNKISQEETTPAKKPKAASRTASKDEEEQVWKRRMGRVRLDAKDRQTISDEIDRFSNQTYRVLAIAFKTYKKLPANSAEEELEQSLTFVGLIASMDPERPEVAPAIQAARAAGIRTVMITGDYVRTAKAIAERLAILPNNAKPDKAIDCSIIRELGSKEADLMEQERGSVLTASDSYVIFNAYGSTNLYGSFHDPGKAGGVELAQQGANKASPAQQLKQVRLALDKITANADVYARAKPQDKITIVRSLQRQGNICSMTGDGVNDAPALKQANIGVAMGMTGTDAAKNAADMILLDDNFVAIIAAIRQGRIIYANIQKFCYFLLSTNVAEVLFMATAVSLGLQAPLVPLQILWLNLTTDGAPAVALAVEEAEPGVMSEGPRPVDEPLMSPLMLVGICIQTVVLTACSMTVYIMGLHWKLGQWNYEFETDEHGEIVPEEDAQALKGAQTMCIIFIVFAELLRAYGARSMRNSLFTIGPFSNWYMQASCFVSAVGTVLVSMTPGVKDVFGMVMLEPRDWYFILGMACAPLVVDEITKAVYRCTGFGLRPQHVAKQEGLIHDYTQYAN